MRRLFTCFLAGCFTLSLSTPIPAEPLPGAWQLAARRPADREQRSGQELERHWDEAKAAFQQGAYRDALRSLDAILAITPADPQAQLYRSLCQRRVDSPPPFRQLSPSELTGLTDRLRREESAERRTRAQLKALDRELRKEQARWDEELAAFEKQADLEARRTAKDASRKQQQAQAEAASRLRAERAAQRKLARAPAPPTRGVPAIAPETAAPAARIPSVRPAESPAHPPRPASRVPAGAPSVELAPVVVPPAPGAGPLAVARVPPPEGAVQIHARQMSVAPDRNLAVAEGDVEVVFEDAILTCDYLTLFTDTKDVYAEGRVRLEEGGQVFRGQLIHYNFDTKKGRFLQGTVSTPPWHEHGRSIEHIAEGILEVTPGYVTSCDHEPPHYKFFGSRSIVYADDHITRSRHATLFVEDFPLIYLPWLSISDRQSPFFIIPGKKKPWGHFFLMGYRYELSAPAEEVRHEGTLKWDWRRHFGWGVGVDHKLESERFGKALLKVYYNDLKNRKEPNVSLPKGALEKRYRVLGRYLWRPIPDTTLIADIQDFSDKNFREDFLFREEFVEDDVSESFVSVVKATPRFTLSGLIKKRTNRFQTVNEILPEVTFDARQQGIGETNLFSETNLGITSFETKRPHSDDDTDVVRVDWFQQFRYALGLFRPILVTPRVGVRQTYYTKDKQGGAERPQGKRDLISGQFTMGSDASLKLFRIFPVVTNALGLNINLLRHVLTPTLAYEYIHKPTVPSSLLTFAAAGGTGNTLTFGLENKFQTKRGVGKGKPGGSFDLARFVISLPYTFRGHGNKRGGRLGDWAFDLELYPWPWLRFETDWSVPSHFIRGSRDRRITTWNTDLVMVGGGTHPEAKSAPKIQVPEARGFQPGPQGGIERFLPYGQWYLGFGHRYDQNSKTESVIQFDWGLSEKWEIGTFHRFDWKEVAGGSKRFHNMREYQYSLRRDLHDWVGEVIYRVDRERGEELFLTLTLKAYPNLPIEFGDSYHQPKAGSQSSPFSPVPQK